MTTKNGRVITTNGVKTVTISLGGTGYNPDTTVVTFSGGGGTGATGYANIVNGSVQSVTLIHPGYGYTSPPVVSFSTGTLASGLCTLANNLLVCYGYEDFTQDGSFDPNNEAQHSNLPDGAVCVGDPWNPIGNVTTWNGSAWKLN